MGNHRHRQHAEQHRRPEGSPGCARRRVLVASGERPMPVNGGGRSFLVKSYDLRSRNLGRTAPLVAHQQGYYNAR